MHNSHAGSCSRLLPLCETGAVAPVVLASKFNCHIKAVMAVVKTSTTAVSRCDTDFYTRVRYSRKAWQLVGRLFAFVVFAELHLIQAMGTKECSFKLDGSSFFCG